MEASETGIKESLPFTNLQELYDNVNNLKRWPRIKKLRETTDYVYRGSDVTEQALELRTFDREMQPRTLVCHDMKGGYLEDRYIDGSKSHDSYLFYHWSVVDTFVYFSHYFITIPPFGWINAAHEHGVRVLGTVITEKEGIWEQILVSQEETRKFADALVLIAKFYNFDGWLLNVENAIKSDQIGTLIYFVKYLTENIHQAVKDSEIIWYDSVTNEGTLSWQNELNEKNIEFFLNCDGIYLNYNWTKTKLENSCTLAKNRNRDVRDIYVGLDVWGRGCPGGGGFNSAHALEKIRREGLSVGIFAAGWTHEFFGPKTFHELEDLFWAQLFRYLYVHVPIYEIETFRSSFCHGSGSSFYRDGEVQFDMRVLRGRNTFEEKSFYNLSLQKPQISVPAPHLEFTQTPEIPEAKSENDRNECSKKSVEYIYETKNSVIRLFGHVASIERKPLISDDNYFEYCNDFSFEGGGCLKLITNNSRLYHRLFLVYVEFENNIEATIVYKETESSIDNGPRDKPILILRNYTGLRSIVCYRSENLNSSWEKCIYRTNMKTVNEIGVSFPRKNVCYLGEIVLDETRHPTGN